MKTVDLLEIKQILNERVKNLDVAIESIDPDSRNFDEATGRYEECKTILTLVDIAIAQEIGHDH